MRVFWLWNSSYSYNRWTAQVVSSTQPDRLSANSEIAWHYAQALREAFGADNVVTLSMGDEFTRDHDGKLTMSIKGHAVEPDDFFIGHIGAWAEQAYDLGLRYIPMVAWPNKMAWPYSKFVYHEQHQRVLDRAELIIPLCGKTVWEASKSDPMLSRWVGKSEQLELGFSRELFPQVKHTFNPPGQRGFLYVGQVGEQKGTGPMVEAFQRLGYPLYIGNGEWKTGPQDGAPHINVMGWVDNADQSFWQSLAPKVDFMLCPTLWDCQPVSPMECLSRGFPVIGTRWACIGEAIRLKDDASDIEVVVRQCQEASDAAVDLSQRVQLSWMDHELRWEPVLDRFVSIIRAYLGRRGS
jgi:glycosyltransferase involved in cell wall biosynthesis